MSTERPEFRFSELVSKVFTYLVTDFTFRCTERTTTFVRFESYTTFVQVYHGRISYHVDVECGLVGKDFAFDIGQLLEFVEKVALERYDPYAHQFSPEKVKLALEKSADYLRRYGQRALLGDVSFFVAIKKYFDDKAAAEFRDAGVPQAILFANAFWKDKNYERVVFYLKPYVKELSKEDRDRYYFALGQLDNR